MNRTRLVLLGLIVLTLALAGSRPAWTQNRTVTEAPTGFDNLTNGLVDQATHDADRDVFAQTFGVADGLGPVYNADSCAVCHANPLPGGNSQVTNLRAGHFNGAIFIDHLGGSLIHDRAIDPAIQERVLGGNEVRTQRLATSLLGLGFVEAIASNALVAISNSQPAIMRGQVIRVPVVEGSGALRVARFGWKNQHASLLSYAAAELLDQLGLTNQFHPVENTSNGRSVAAFDMVPDPELQPEVIEALAQFIRTTKAPSRDAALAATADALVGSALFDAIGCVVCHVRSITTAPAGTVINGGTFTVPAALGDKLIHPFSDFLLHNIGSGDGIVQNGGPSTRNTVRTAPLWGMRTKPRLMHDGQSLTRTDAIERHGGQATSVRNNFHALSANQKNQLITFLNSL